jgi:hypothetical protein
VLQESYESLQEGAASAVVGAVYDGLHAVHIEEECARVVDDRCLAVTLRLAA